jgi:hypothetical protein
LKRKNANGGIEGRTVEE